MKLKLLTSLFFISFGSYAQTYVKLNGATSLLGIPGIGIEVPVSKKMSFQLDATMSFWNSVSIGKYSERPYVFNQIFPDEVSGIIFLAAFMGWMPAPLDVSIWQSIWTKEKLNLNNKIKYKSALFDFNVGYISTVFLGLCFVALGAFVMFGSGQTFSNNGSEFANQLIKLYTANLGENVKIFISVAAFTTMLSTTITCLDASPRAMSQTLKLLNHKKISGYNTWILIISIVTMIIFVFFESEMGTLIKIATILSFITAPIYAIMNYSLVNSGYMPKKFKLSKSMKFYSISGIIFLTIFSIWYITLI